MTGRIQMSIADGRNDLDAHPEDIDIVREIFIASAHLEKFDDHTEDQKHEHSQEEDNAERMQLQ